MPNSYPQNRILVVDDDPAICELLSIKLRKAGFNCKTCVKAEDALKVLSEEPLDAVISDLNMPGISGFEMLEATRRHLPHAAFLMATGVNDLSVGLAAMKQGATDYILKPFQVDAVINGLQRALSIKRMEMELEEYRKHLEQMVDKRTNQLSAAMQRIESTYDETLEALAAALDLRDNETAGHSRRVTLFALEMARVVGLTPIQLKDLERGAYLHDIGKIGIPDSILLKPGKLTEEETAIMRTHVRIGYELMSRVAFLSSAAQIVLAHQEYFNGSGYPQGLAGEEIPLGARIFSVADTLDAIMSDRPYRRGRPYSVARDIIAEETGKQFDPQIVRAFLSIPEATWAQIRQETAQARPNVQHNLGKERGELTELPAKQAC